MSDEIRWNREKKDQRDQEIARELMKQKVVRAYNEWKANLKSKRKLKIQDIEKSAQDMRLQVVAALTRTGLIDDPWGKQTLAILDGKIADITAAIAADDVLKTKTAHINIFTRYLPDRPDGQPQTPETYEFKTETELRAIPFVASIIRQDGFVGIVREDNKLIGLFASGELVLLGAVATRVGIERIPTKEEMTKAILHSKRN